MPVEFFDLALELARKTVGTKRGTATGGSTTTLVDAGRREDTRSFKYGVLFPQSGLLARRLIEVASFDRNTFGFVDQGIGNLAAAGDRYEACDQDLMLETIRRCVNVGLAEIGDIRLENTGLTVAASQDEYTLPAGVNGGQRLLRVEIARFTTAPLYYAKHHHWDAFDTKLRFAPGWEPWDVGKTIRLTYLGPHPALNAAGDDLDPQISLAWAAWAAAVVFYRDEWKKIKGDDDSVTTLLQDAISQRERAAGHINNGRDARFADWG